MLLPACAGFGWGRFVFSIVGNIGHSFGFLLEAVLIIQEWFSSC